MDRKPLAIEDASYNVQLLNSSTTLYFKEHVYRSLTGFSDLGHDQIVSLLVLNGLDITGLWRMAA